ncbi:transposase [Micromonospora sp. NBC_01655]|uniref:transposase n=1 Tax=Micromonospora sp. NBC_01655 TaxID=2975983 RepID=UPI002255EADB|nr:transposase [Micromonospora sp. NBC_01655]MCX4471598.1 transposase [Micromonospora sp. NBC_01655]
MDRPGSCGDWLKAGRSVAELVRDLEISDQTIYNWRRQELIDTAQMPGVTSHDQGELMAARRRVAELETELTIHRRSVKIRIEPGPATGPAVMATLRNTAIGYHQIGGETNIARATRRAIRGPPRHHHRRHQQQCQNAMTLPRSTAQQRVRGNRLQSAIFHPE